MSSDQGTVTRRDALRIMASFGVAAVAGGGALIEIVRRSGLHHVSVSKARLGTLVEISVVHPDRAAAHDLIELAFATIDRLETILSRHRPDSALSVLNRTGEINAPPADLVAVLEPAQQVAVLTGGAFDPTVLPLLELHASTFAGTGTAPSTSAVMEAMSRVGHDHLRVSAQLVSLERPGMAVTLDGIGKGYVVDRTVALLVNGGADRVMVDAGGDIASGGEGSATDPWRIGLQHPRAGGLVSVVSLAGEAVATSGDYQQNFTEDRVHHHIIDPRTGWSPARTAAASVTASTAMEADALSTAAMVLGPESAMPILEKLPGVEATLVTKEGHLHSTSGSA